MLSASARMSPVSDPQQSRLTAVGKRQGLPQDNQRLRLGKLADGKTSKIRILTLNVIQYNTIQYNKLYFTSDTDNCKH